MEDRDQTPPSSNQDSDTDANISITVKFGGRSIPITPSLDSSIKDVKSLLQPLTNVLPRGQKLIFKGKILDDSMTLRASEVKNGAKVMLMASQGLHQGEGPILKAARAQPIIRGTNRSYNVAKEKAVATVDKTHLERWKITGVVALAERNLELIPDEVWTCGPSTRILDISNNSVEYVPPRIGSLTSMQKLFMNANGLSDQSINWEGLSSLKFLTVLSMNQNDLTALPPALGAISSLRQLYVANNKLTSLPMEIGHLTQLEVLKVNSNRMSTLPTHIGDCISLVEVDLSSNLLSELPETLGNMRNLKALYLSNNGLHSLPGTLFTSCIQLSTLDLHNTEITVDVLRQIEGWEGFDERRRSKHQKQLDFRVVGSAEFDESADKK
ncbi:LRR repeats and ubiquitin-like domain-containing protein At2g30105 isoform X2 [Rhodamnia argentea]|uniref:LRR repeats and ubiquitin-like domain-containing protein At2g30105 isoform X2 n=1 Tax=Rhodamnia argentea TaxID=178133 RepID=A0A8B8PRV2_9MYRT|nr:LRR repeats and ubiquitin-like domain-containing protein At2g30105 isoform X2 [Rhodamnia argentea]